MPLAENQWVLTLGGIKDAKPEAIATHLKTAETLGKQAQ